MILTTLTLFDRLDHCANIDEESLVDINDWAVNSLREWAADRADTYPVYDTRDGQRGVLGLLVNTEAKRINDEELNVTDYVKRASREGSRFPLSRRARLFVFAIVKTREALSA